METWDSIVSRRNVREFANRAISEDDLDLVLEAARRAPSSKNWQPWDFVAVNDRDQLADLAEVGQYAGYLSGAAAAIGLVVRDFEDAAQRETAAFDLGQASISIMLCAADLGVASGHVAVFDQDVARRVLGLPDDRVCPYVVALGYPAGRPLKPVKQPNRRSFDEVVHRHRW